MPTMSDLKNLLASYSWGPSNNPRPDADKWNNLISMIQSGEDAPVSAVSEPAPPPGYTISPGPNFVMYNPHYEIFAPAAPMSDFRPIGPAELDATNRAFQNTVLNSGSLVFNSGTNAINNMNWNLTTLASMGVKSATEFAKSAIAFANGAMANVGLQASKVPEFSHSIWDSLF